MNYLDEQIPGGMDQNMVGVVSAWEAHGACISLIRPRSWSVRDLDGHIVVTNGYVCGVYKVFVHSEIHEEYPLAIVHGKLPSRL